MKGIVKGLRKVQGCQHVGRKVGLELISMLL